MTKGSLVECEDQKVKFRCHRLAWEFVGRVSRTNMLPATQFQHCTFVGFFFFFIKSLFSSALSSKTLNLYLGPELSRDQSKPKKRGVSKADS